MSHCGLPIVLYSCLYKKSDFEMTIYLLTIVSAFFSSSLSANPLFPSGLLEHPVFHGVIHKGLKRKPVEIFEWL